MDYALDNICYLLLFRLKGLLFHPLHEILETLTSASVSLVMPAQFPVLAFHFIYYFFTLAVWLEAVVQVAEDLAFKLLTLLGYVYRDNHKDKNNQRYFHLNFKLLADAVITSDKTI